MTLEETAHRLYTLLSQTMLGNAKVFKNLDLDRGNVSPRAIRKFMRALEDKFGGKLHVADVGSLTSAYTIDRIRAEVDIYRPDMFWVDYLTLLKAPSGHQQEYTAVRSLSNGIKSIAMQFRCVGGCSAQVNRDAMSKKAFLPRPENISFGDCLSGTQVIQTKSGMTRLQDVVDKELIVFDGENWEKACVRKVGYKREWIITFEDGTEVRGSKDHKIFLQTGLSSFEWVPINRATEGDYGLVFGEFNKGDDKIDQKAISCFYDGNKTQLIPATEITTDLAICMGLLVGDGWIQTDETWNLSLARIDPDVGKFYQQAIEKTFAKKTKLDKQRYGEVDVIRLSARPIIRQLTYLGMPREYSHSKYIPWSILKSSQKVRAAFLKGLFEADGTITATAIDLATTSTQMAKEVQVLLRSLGIDSTTTTKELYYGLGAISSYPNGKAYKRRDMNRIRIKKHEWDKFENIIGFLSSRKNEKLRTYPRLKTKPTVYSKPLGAYLRPIRVISVVDTRREELMFDVFKKVKGAESYTANGIVVHNSIGHDANLIISLNRKDEWLYYGVVKNRHGPEFGPIRTKFFPDLGIIEESQTQTMEEDDD
jgi:intein/homing endonuclease